MGSIPMPGRTTTATPFPAIIALSLLAATSASPIGWYERTQSVVVPEQLRRTDNASLATIQTGLSLASDVNGEATTQPALAFVVSGGGFRTMTAGFAFARALSRAGLDWSRVTHIAGNSGGQWFAVQLAYAPDLLNDLHDVNKPLQDVLMGWAAAYNNVLEAQAALQSKVVQSAAVAPEQRRRADNVSLATSPTSLSADGGRWPHWH